MYSGYKSHTPLGLINEQQENSSVLGKVGDTHEKVNVVIDSMGAERAYNRIDPYFPLAVGSAATTTCITDGDIVYSEKTPYMKPLLDYQKEMIHSQAVPVLNTLNGMGHKGIDNEHSVLSKLNIIGIASDTNNSNNGSFTAISRGLVRLINGGDRRINSGDKLMVGCPNEKQIKDTNQSGVIKLIVKSYDEDIHHVTVRNIWECLKESDSMESNEETRFLESYVRMAKCFMESIEKIITISTEVLHEDNNFQDYFENHNDHKHKTFFEFLGEDVKRKLCAALFYPHSDEEFDNIQKNLPVTSEIRSDHLGRFLHSLMYLDNDTKNKLIGDAITSGNPGDKILACLDIKK